MTSTENYETIDFRPAPAGWTVVHLGERSAWCRFEARTDTPDRCKACEFPKANGRHLGVREIALPGWLIQRDANTGHQRVVAAQLVEDGELWEIGCLGRWNTSAWYIKGPGEPMPTVEDVIEERDGREVQYAAHLAEQERKRVQWEDGPVLGTIQRVRQPAA